MPFPDERGILIKDPWGVRPVVTTAVPGVPVASLAQASVDWLRTCGRDAVTLSTGNVMIAVTPGMSETDVCMAFSRATHPAGVENPPIESAADSPPTVPAPLHLGASSTNANGAWNIRAFIDSRPV